MNKLTLLLIALVYVHFNNAMNDQKTITLKFIAISTQYAEILKMDHRDLPLEMRYACILYTYKSRIKDVPTIHLKHDIEKQEYSGVIEKTQSLESIENNKEFIEIQDQSKLKTMIEHIELLEHYSKQQ